MNLHDFFIGFAFVAVGSVLIPIVSYFFSKEKTKLSGSVLIYLLASLFSDVCNRLYYFGGYKDYLILNIYTVVEFTVLCYIYSQMLRSKKVITVFFSIFWCVFFVCTFFFQPINEFQTIPLVFESLAAIAFSIAYASELYRCLPTENLFRYFPFLVSAAFFFYFAFNLFLFAGAAYVFKIEPHDVAYVLWYGLHNLGEIIKNCVLAAGFCLATMKTSERTN